jgi:hypothetical protein
MAYWGDSQLKENELLRTEKLSNHQKIIKNLNLNIANDVKGFFR